MVLCCPSPSTFANYCTQRLNNRLNQLIRPQSKRKILMLTYKDILDSNVPPILWQQNHILLGVHISLALQCMCIYLVGVVHKVDRYAEGQRVMVWVSQENGQNFHARRLGFPFSILQHSLHWPLTVHCILSYLTPLHTHIHKFTQKQK